MIKNIEKNNVYNIPNNFNAKKTSGVSVFMRIKNEEEWIAPCLLAIIDLIDEINIVFNNSTDKTKDIVRYIESDKIKIYNYPFNIEFRGPKHSKIHVNSLKHSAYYYNWCLSKTTKQWTIKWDGDNVATSKFEQTFDVIKSNKYKAITNTGIDIINIQHIGEQELVSYEPRIFELDGNCFYSSSPNKYTQQLYFSKPRLVYQIKEPSFLHMKYSKTNPHMYWPKEWQQSNHFNQINEKHKPIKKYNGLYPIVLKDYLELNKNPFSLIETYKNTTRNPREMVKI